MRKLLCCALFLMQLQQAYAYADPRWTSDEMIGLKSLVVCGDPAMALSIYNVGIERGDEYARFKAFWTFDCYVLESVSIPRAVYELCSMNVRQICSRVLIYQIPEKILFGVILPLNRR